jgi:drug/metabolite transporter (DMT)-like permease
MKRAISLSGFAILIGIGITWGSSYLLIKKALSQLQYAEIGAFRMVMAATFFSPWLISGLKKLNKKDIVPLIVVAFCGSGIPALLFPLAQTKIGSGLAGIMSSTTPLFTMLFAGLFFKIPLNRFKISGIITGFAGTLLLILGSGSSSVEGSIGHASIILIATSLYAISSNTVNKYLSHQSSFTISAVAFAILAIPSVSILLYNESFAKLSKPEIWSAAMIPLFVLSFLGTFLATYLFFQLIKKEGVIFSSTVSYIIPVVALLLALIDGETLNFIHIAGMSIILVGIFLSSSKK